jgi:hypothetical protein
MSARISLFLLLVAAHLLLESCNDKKVPHFSNAETSSDSESLVNEGNETNQHCLETDCQNESPTIEKPESGNCSGKFIENACWYLSERGESCTSACSDHGGYNEATKTFAGSGGSDENCLIIGKGFFPNAVNVRSRGTNNQSIGCAVYPVHLELKGDLYRFTRATTEGSVVEADHRFCACNS